MTFVPEQKWSASPSPDELQLPLQLDHIRKVYGRTRALLAIACSINRELVRSLTRSVANEEFHGTCDHVNETARATVRDQPVQIETEIFGVLVHQTRAGLRFKLILRLIEDPEPFPPFLE